MVFLEQTGNSHYDEPKPRVMKKFSFNIRRRIIATFLLVALAVFIFALFSFQVHKEIGLRLKLLELADDLFHNILEIRRFEKNFFLYKEPASLAETRAYINRVEELYLAHEPEILRLRKEFPDTEFRQTLQRYQEIIGQLEARPPHPSSETGAPTLATLEESLRNLGGKLVEVTERLAQQERLKIDQLFQRALSLFVVSMLVFIVFGTLLAFYIVRLLVRPLMQMQQAMEKIAHGDFTPIPEPASRAEEFFILFRAFNRMIHELEEHQEQLVQSRKIAAVGTLTAGIAHELNNPINNIVLSAEALKEDFSQLSQEEALAITNDIMAQAERASEIVKDLLDFSRTEQPEFEALAISDLIDDSLKLVRNQLLLSGIQEEIEIPANPPGLYGDRKSLLQVFLNLFINAVQAMPDGGVLGIRAEISDQCPWSSTSAPRALHWLKVEVKDTGVGIDPEDLPLIFDPFFTTKAVGKGTGLGLSVTYSIIQKHGGHIEVQSHKGLGTTFTVFLPLREER
jgi:two-component system NtrC family sensor kinase